MNTQRYTITIFMLFVLILVTKNIVVSAPAPAPDTMSTTTVTNFVNSTCLQNNGTTTANDATGAIKTVVTDATTSS
ncbi:2766_t:CDS:2 [Ambispora leptoticha]|uniref:2766_t:CDS:1 n=1 Tax=Ambispora leptoticha TaxID=144679 RepID=A0A9N8W9M1_9GLOM|nr:2766_t:CDS:2 [Ambispora leptoticha]